LRKYKNRNKRLLHLLTSQVAIPKNTVQIINRSLLLIGLTCLLLGGCTGIHITSLNIQTETPLVPTPSLTPVSTTTPTPTETPLSTNTPPPTSTFKLEPAGCLKPPDDYTRIEVNGWIINQRTLSMLIHAQELYGGELEITGSAITQGSYQDSVAASFGTHAGGGAVDISVLRKNTYTVMWDDINPLLRALRLAGFAAWLRDYGELYTDSPIHIHAIAIGDRELSPAAEDQLTGPAGYFRGFSGLPTTDTTPAPDRFGVPILCQWMIDLGFLDLR
jgi:hypothetical protein